MSCKRDTNEERSHIIFYTPTSTATLYRHIMLYFGICTLNIKIYLTVIIITNNNIFILSHEKCSIYTHGLRITHAIIL